MVSDARGGFLFDRAGHWLHLRDERIRALVEELLGGEVLEVVRDARVYSHGVLTRYPFQANTHGLPPEVIRDCVVGFVRARDRRLRKEPEPEGFEEYISYHLGEGIARHFMVPYNRKLWGVELGELSAAWCGRFVPRPGIEEVVSGAVGLPVEGLGYNASFFYPRQGGIGSLSRGLAASLSHPVELGVEALALDLAARRLRTSTGEWISFDTLVSTLPLPALVDLLCDAPTELVEARGRLRAASVAVVNLGLRCPGRPLWGAHWVYVPEEGFPFYRVGAYSNAVPYLSAPGCSSLYVELSIPPGRRLEDHDGLLSGVLQGLERMGALPRGSDLLVGELRVLRDAYVIFDHEREAALRTVKQHLGEEQGVHSIGRYGRWTYGSMEDAMIDGLETARQIDGMEYS